MADIINCLLSATIIMCTSLVCFSSVCVLTKDCDVDAGAGLLVLNEFVSMAYIGSTVRHRGAREHQVGAHGYG